MREFLEEHAPPVVGWSFRSMDMAEDAIADASKRWPESAELLSSTFLLLKPRYEVFGRAHAHIVRSHMDELLARVARDGEGADVALGTAAEVCCACCELSLAAPLRHDHAVAYHVAFIDALGDERAIEILGEEAVRRAHMDRDEHWKAEIYAELRKHMSDDERQKAWRERTHESAEPDIAPVVEEAVVQEALAI